MFSVKYGPYAETSDEVMNLCTAYKCFSSKNQDVLLHDILYVEEFDILLPIQGKEDDKSDSDALMGAWLTEGLQVNATDMDKVCLVNQWLTPESIEEAVMASGLKIKRSIKGKVKEKEKKPDKPPKLKGDFVLPGREKLSQYFNDQIIDFIKNIKKYEKMGITSVPATLLYGHPGCGKTYAVERLAEYLNLPCFEINSSSVASPYIHDTSKRIAEVFAKAIDAAPSILIIDEIEAYVSTRSNSGSGTHHIEEVDEFLRNIPKAIDAKVIIFGMTNMIDLIDPAILRKGRFDFVEEVGMPSKQEVIAVLTSGLSKLPVKGKIDYDMVAEKLLDRPMSDVGYVIRQAARIAVKNNCDKVDQEHLLSAVNSLGVPKNEGETHRRIGFK